MEKEIEKKIKEFEEKFPPVLFCWNGNNSIGNDSSITTQKKLKKFLKSAIEDAYQEGKRDGEINEAVKRYDQAKEDDTLDKHFPRI